MENWLPVVGYEGRYEVSDCGRVRALFRTPGWVGSERTLRPYGGSRGKRYKIVGLCLDGIVTKMRVHRLVMTAFVRPPLDDEQVNHINGDPSDNRLENLEWCSPKENMAHAWRTGLLPHPPLNPPGEMHPTATITEATALEIIRRGANGERTCDIARAVGTTYKTASYIKRGQTWRHLPRPAALA